MPYRKDRDSAPTALLVKGGATRDSIYGMLTVVMFDGGLSTPEESTLLTI